MWWVVGYSSMWWVVGIALWAASLAASILRWVVGCRHTVVGVVWWVEVG